MVDRGPGAPTAARCRSPNTSTGPGPGAELAEAVAHGVGGDRAGGAGGRERGVAEREVGGEGARVRAARSVGGAVGVPRAAELLERVAVEEDVDEPLAVAAGDDDGLGPEAVERAGEVLGLRLRVAARRARAPRGGWA